MTIVEQLHQRADGSQVKVVAQAFFGRGLHFSVGIHVLCRNTHVQPWKLMSDRPHPEWRTMSVDEYVKHGRSEMLRTASISEILKASNALHIKLGM